MCDIHFHGPGNYNIQAEISIRLLQDESVVSRLDGIEASQAEMKATLSQLNGKIDTMNSGVQEIQGQIDALAAEESQRADVEQSAMNALTFLLNKVQEAVDTTNSLPALRDQLATIVQAGTEKNATLAAAVAAVPTA